MFEKLKGSIKKVVDEVADILTKLTKEYGMAKKKPPRIEEENERLHIALREPDFIEICKGEIQIESYTFQEWFIDAAGSDEEKRELEELLHYIEEIVAVLGEGATIHAGESIDDIKKKLGSEDVYNNMQYLVIRLKLRTIATYFFMEAPMGLGAAYYDGLFLIPEDTGAGVGIILREAALEEFKKLNIEDLVRELRRIMYTSYGVPLPEEEASES